MSLSIFGISFKTLRIFILAVILFVVAMSALATRLHTTDWDLPLWVVIYPINGDGSQTSSDYINLLDGYDFEPIKDFMAQEAEDYELSLANPVSMNLAPEIMEIPPKPPQKRNLLNVMWWSLNLRYWAYKYDTYEGPSPDIRLFLVYYDPDTHKVLDHSLGLQKGLISIVNVFADRMSRATNNVVITHELLHTVGATDKYDFTTRHPVHPDGYAEPDLEPLFPQRFAEIMGGRMPLSETESEIPASLDEVIIGYKTGQEIRWIK
jgi:hypothetical protein